MTEDRRPWQDVQRDFRRFVAERGVDEVARMVPISRTQIYEIIRGRVHQPKGPTRYVIERVVGDDADE